MRRAANILIYDEYIRGRHQKIHKYSRVAALALKGTLIYDKYSRATANIHLYWTTPENSQIFTCVANTREFAMEQARIFARDVRETTFLTSST